VAAVTELALLSAWESASGRPAPDRAVTLAAAASGLPAEDVADLPLGACDLLLLQLREQCFGPRLDGLVECPRCGAELDVRIDVDELQVGGAEDARTVEVEGRTVRLRALTSRDIRSCGGDRDRLLTRCILGEPGVGGELADGGDPAGPSRAVLDAVEAQLDALDPQAAAAIDINCASCGASWPASVDVTEFVWSEVDRFARRLLHDVHTLATAYGWCEADVLAVSPARRRFYLGVCGS
jgi:hypothetical protein